RSGDSLKRFRFSSDENSHFALLYSYTRLSEPGMAFDVLKNDTGSYPWIALPFGAKISDCWLYVVETITKSNTETNKCFIICLSAFLNDFRPVLVRIRP